MTRIKSSYYIVKAYNISRLDKNKCNNIANKENKEKFLE